MKVIVSAVLISVLSFTNLFAKYDWYNLAQSDLVRDISRNYYMAVDEEGILWIQHGENFYNITEEGLHKIDKLFNWKYSHLKGLQNGGLVVNCFDGEGKETAFLYSKKKWTEHPEILINYDQYQDFEKNIWICQRDGVVKKNNEKILALDASAVSPTARLFEDKSRRLWIYPDYEESAKEVFKGFFYIYEKNRLFKVPLPAGCKALPGVLIEYKKDTFTTSELHELEGKKSYHRHDLILRNTKDSYVLENICMAKKSLFEGFLSVVGLYDLGANDYLVIGSEKDTSNMASVFRMKNGVKTLIFEDIGKDYNLSRRNLIQKDKDGYFWIRTLEKNILCLDNNLKAHLIGPEKGMIMERPDIHIDRLGNVGLLCQFGTMQNSKIFNERIAVLRGSKKEEFIKENAKPFFEEFPSRGELLFDGKNTAYWVRFAGGTLVLSKHDGEKAVNLLDIKKIESAMKTKDSKATFKAFALDSRDRVILLFKAAGKDTFLTCRYSLSELTKDSRCEEMSFEDLVLSDEGEVIYNFSAPEFGALKSTQNQAFVLLPAEFKVGKKKFTGMVVKTEKNKEWKEIPGFAPEDMPASQLYTGFSGDTAINIYSDGLLKAFAYRKEKFVEIAETVLPPSEASAKSFERLILPGEARGEEIFVFAEHGRYTGLGETKTRGFVFQKGNALFKVDVDFGVNSEVKRKAKNIKYNGKNGYWISFYGIDYRRNLFVPEEVLNSAESREPLVFGQERFRNWTMKSEDDVVSKYQRLQKERAVTARSKEAKRVFPNEVLMGLSEKKPGKTESAPVKEPKTKKDVREIADIYNDLVGSDEQRRLIAFNEVKNIDEKAVAFLEEKKKDMKDPDLLWVLESAISRAKEK